MNDSPEKPATATSKWTRHQLESLQALGIPLYSFVQQSTTSQEFNDQAPRLNVESEPEFNDQAPRSNIEFHYRLGGWTLRTAERLPVELYPWLKDLSSHLQQQLTEIKADPQQPHLDVTPWCKTTLSPEEKRDLWNQLKLWLN
ncbi:hypothetical protein [Aliidiomarina soli]|uniref:Uncharacterized protein n=1 Tax=Aliidiomarina soli TaxID=1928574 RepID=A0A432WD75_9GAMM|nr:hypothetical protein [Aliidiomarina soli]RUO30359.1 hypothetical protein CWE14_13410 [Aliidiomarina soli]